MERYYLDNANFGFNENIEGNIQPGLYVEFSNGSGGKFKYDALRGIIYDDENEPRTQLSKLQGMLFLALTVNSNRALSFDEIYSVLYPDEVNYAELDPAHIRLKSIKSKLNNILETIHGLGSCIELVPKYGYGWVPDPKKFNEFLEDKGLKGKHAENNIVFA